MAAPDRSNTAPHISFERERGVYAVDVTRDVGHALITVEGGDAPTGQFARVFDTLARATVPVFLIKLHSSALTCALIGNDVARAAAALEAAGFTAETRRDLALISIRASSMRDLSGVIAALSDALYAADVRMYSTGDSHNSVQCLVDGDRVQSAIDAICREFALGPSAVHALVIDSGAAA